MTEQSTKLKLYVAFVKLNLAITEAARLEVITLMQSTRQKAVILINRLTALIEIN